MKEVAMEQQQKECCGGECDCMSGLPFVEWNERPTSFMEEVYEESVIKLMDNYHRLSVEEIEFINRIADRL